MMGYAKVSDELREIMRRIGDAADQLDHLANRPGPRDPQPADIERAIKLLSKGDKPATIALQLGVPVSFVRECEESYRGRKLLEKDILEKADRDAVHRAKLLAVGKTVAEMRDKGMSYEQIIGDGYATLADIQLGEKWYREDMAVAKALDAAE